MTQYFFWGRLILNYKLLSLKLPLICKLLYFQNPVESQPIEWHLTAEPAESIGSVCESHHFIILWVDVYLSSIDRTR